MEPEVKNDYTSSSTEASEPNSGVITKLPSSATDEAGVDWQKTTQQVNAFIQEFPGFLADFWRNYKLPVTVFLFALAFIVTSKVLLAILGAINDLPFLAPLFELIGLSYFAWFVIRYLWSGSGRQELSDNIDSVKSQVIGTQEQLLDRLSGSDK